MLGGYAEQRVDRPYHQIYDPVADRWSDGAPLPRGANHVGVCVVDAKLYAIGGHLAQNAKPDALCFVLELKTGAWSPIAPLPNRCGAIAATGLSGRVHAIGGAIGDAPAEKKSVDWHYAYDSKSDRWEKLAPLPTGRDHTGTVTVGNFIHVIGGRVTISTRTQICITRMTRKGPLGNAASAADGAFGPWRSAVPGQDFVMGGEGADRVRAERSLRFRDGSMGSVRADAYSAARSWRCSGRRCDTRRWRRADCRWQRSERCARGFYARLLVIQAGGSRCRKISIVRMKVKPKTPSAHVRARA